MLDLTDKGCILSKFYIKPQQGRGCRDFCQVVSYRNSTSNHNHPETGPDPRLVVSYRNSTSNHNVIAVISTRKIVVSYRNSTSNHNLFFFVIFALSVVSYRNSTSNHNYVLHSDVSKLVVSYRNSTSNHNSRAAGTISAGLYLIEILHQTTTCGKCEDCLRRCILSKFYIKPQLACGWHYFRWVVSYRNSTSNHNYSNSLFNWLRVVSYRNSTSNHNSDAVSMTGVSLYLIEILHQTTTHVRLALFPLGCILSKFYIKPQRCILYNILGCGCILSKFYIKPQLVEKGDYDLIGCILSKFYIKPQLAILFCRSR